MTLASTGSAYPVTPVVGQFFGVKSAQMVLENCLSHWTQHCNIL